MITVCWSSQKDCDHFLSLINKETGLVIGDVTQLPMFYCNTCGTPFHSITPLRDHSKICDNLWHVVASVIVFMCCYDPLWHSVTFSDIFNPDQKLPFLKCYVYLDGPLISWANDVTTFLGIDVIKTKVIVLLKISKNTDLF